MTKVFSAKPIESGSNLIQDTIKQTFYTSLYTKYITNIYMIYYRYSMKFKVYGEEAKAIKEGQIFKAKIKYVEGRCVAILEAEN